MDNILVDGSKLKYNTLGLEFDARTKYNIKYNKTLTMNTMKKHTLVRSHTLLLKYN